MKNQNEMVTVNQGQVQQDARAARAQGVAAVLQAIPLFVWGASICLLVTFIALAVGFNIHQLPDFVNTVLRWLFGAVVVLIVIFTIRLVLRAHDIYHDIVTRHHERQGQAAAVQRQKLLIDQQRLKNQQLEVKIELERQLPLVIKYALEHGHNITYNSKEGLQVQNYLSNVHSIQGQLPGPGQEENAPADELPTNVAYEDIRGQVPRGHILVGVGSQGVETKNKAVGACLWIVGLSGTGKTSTTVLRVEERAADKHGFLGVDPHAFKPDSLYHAIYETEDGQPGPYKDRFFMPMATTPEETRQVLQMFLDEFNARKAGQRPKPWQRVTLLVDEVNALMDATTKEEKAIAEMLPSIARICGQEARNFEMGGIFISQQATGLAWLRKVALMIIVHQLLQESEKKLATNNDTEAMAAMKRWPIGRTYVYGVGFQEGPRTVQQPYFKPAGYDAGEKILPDENGAVLSYDDGSEFIYIEDEPTTEPALTLPEDEQESLLENQAASTSGQLNQRTTGNLVLSAELRAALVAWKNGAQGPRAMQRALNCTYYQAGELCKELKRRRLVEAD